MSAMPMGMPGWPELAAWTASAARKRMALARSRRVGVVMGWLEIGKRGAERAAAPARGAIVPQRERRAGFGAKRSDLATLRAEIAQPREKDTDAAMPDFRRVGLAPHRGFQIARTMIGTKSIMAA